VRLRTRVHPAAADFEVESYDDWYEEADSFEQLYERIVEDLVRLAHTSPAHEVVYAVPGSPVVAERTVELLLERSDVQVVCEPAVSVIDVACCALGVDPMARGLRVLDALDGVEPFRGPGPLLILQTYAPEILAIVVDRLPPDTPVVVLHHLGLEDESIVTLNARDLASFASADHLTSIYVAGLRGAGEAMDDLVSFTRRLRAECPWDMEQTHASLTRHLVEETYEALDALEALAAMIESGDEDETIVAHAEEELGDLLFQVVFHAELGDEEGRFNLATVADTERDKLTFRHPHVFADVVVHSADEVAERWEVLKKVEKGRASVLDGVAWQLPSLSLHAKVLKKARALGSPRATGDDVARWNSALAAMQVHVVNDVDESVRGVGLNIDPRVIASALVALSGFATTLNFDLESLLREQTLLLRDQIRDIEANQSDPSHSAE
jgi:tetrapyrrole methylase family protein/MazG family protein